MLLSFPLIKNTSSNYSQVFLSLFEVIYIFPLFNSWAMRYIYFCYTYKICLSLLCSFFFKSHFRKFQESNGQQSKHRKVISAQKVQLYWQKECMSQAIAWGRYNSWTSLWSMITSHTSFFLYSFWVPIIHIKGLVPSSGHYWGNKTFSRWRLGGNWPLSVLGTQRLWPFPPSLFPGCHKMSSFFPSVSHHNDLPCYQLKKWGQGTKGWNLWTGSLIDWCW